MTRQRVWQLKNPHKLPTKTAKKNYDRRYHLAKKYGITEAWYRLLLQYQGHGCAICSKKIAKTRSGRLHIDHDHETFNVRGLLCGPCNLGLGCFQDSPFLLQMAWAYLTISKEVKDGIRITRSA